MSEQIVQFGGAKGTVKFRYQHVEFYPITVFIAHDEGAAAGSNDIPNPVEMVVGNVTRVQDISKVTVLVYLRLRVRLYRVERTF